MRDALLILNAGSSSLKFSVFALESGLEPLVRGQVQALDTAPTFVAADASGREIGSKVWPTGEPLSHGAAVEHILNWARHEALSTCRLVAAGHRVVHGGTMFTGPVRIDSEVLSSIESLVPLAPLHQPHNLAAIAAVTRQSPGLPQVACFDTAFHQTQSAIAQTYAIPRKYTDSGVRRYGFHGLSYEFIASALSGIAPAAARGRTIVAHLGSGASMCAMLAGQSVATTMGFTPMDGLVMGTRCGAIDPGVILYLQQHLRLGIDEISDILSHQSGLLGVSGISSDMRTLLASNDPHAREAIELFVYRAASQIGSLAASLGGLDAIVFTGGIGEHAAPIRAAICTSSRWLGVELDETANDRGGPCISRPGSRVQAWVIKTNEELTIARQTLAVLQSTRS